VRLQRLVAGVVGLVLVSVACGGDNGGAAGSGDEGSDKVRVALIMPDSRNDFSWNQQAFEGAQTLEKQGKIEFAWTDEVGQDASSFNPVAEKYAQQGYDLIIAHSFDYGEPVLRLAPNYPDVNFAWSGSALEEDTAANVGDYAQHWYQGAYLAGILMAGASKTGKLGGIGGFDIPTCHAQYAALEAGAKLVDPNITVEVSYLGTWFDPAKEKEAALALYDSGIDIISVCGTQVGIVEAAKDRNLGVVGQVHDQAPGAPGNVLTSIVLNTEKLFGLMVDDVANGDFQPGKVYDVGVKEGVIVVEPNPSYKDPVSDKAMKIYQETLAGMQDGSIEVPFVPA
jgi:basic membrane protein A and related proteins